MSVAPARATRAGWDRIDWLAVSLIAAVAAAVRLRAIRAPGGMIFDEFYANDGCFYLYSSPSLCNVPHEITPVHPPLGKWLIAAGIRLFGYDPTGWRIASVVAGTLTVVALYVLTRKLLRSTVGAAVASGLLALDLLHFVMSRVAMLDVFVTFFSVVAFLCLAFDRDRLLRRGGIQGTGRRALLGRPWRVAAGAAAGAAAASKWSGWLTLGAIIVLSVAWEVTARRRDDRAGALRATVREEGWSVVLGLVVVPLLVYTMTFAGRVDGDLVAWPWADGSWIRSFLDRQVAMAKFHLPLGGDNPYSSPAWSWLLVKRPVVLYLFQASDETVREVVATGNPLIWWTAIAALGYLGMRWLHARSPAANEGVAVTGFAFAFVPWLVAGIFRHQLFLFYLLPAVPFMCLALAHAAVRVGRALPGRIAVGALVLVAVVGFAFFYPVMTATPLSPPSWRARVLFRDCGRPIAPPAAIASTNAPGGPTIRSEPASEGWCWL